MQSIDVSADGRLVFNGKTYRCALGPAGIIPAPDKREGDLATPAGHFPIREIWYRKDRLTLPPVKFRVHEITPSDGWCDVPEHPQYNRHVKLPSDAAHEKLWRDEDDLYNIIVVIGHNDAPPVPGMGSCIFWHIARPAYTPTHGCVAISQADMLDILPQLNAEDIFHIHAP
jgi:L,D-peptidoglycan transpeptidase YkuD (ErfK/YbiS/YcfS/YnhG family)